MYSKEELLDGLNTSIVGSKLFVFESLDSTNACAKTLAKAGMDDGSVILAEFQTEGRGRLGRSWLSEPGKNLLFSCIIRPALSKEQSGILTFFAAVAVARALETTALNVECKWPNDLLLNGKKCCGILVENSLGKEHIEYSVIGVGVNVNQREFRHGGLTEATSIASECGKEVDRKKIFQNILRELDTLYADVRLGHFSRILLEWNNHCRMFGRAVSVAREGTTLSGKAVGLSSDGGLVIETPQGKEIVYAGDVTVVV